MGGGGDVEDFPAHVAMANKTACLVPNCARHFYHCHKIVIVMIVLYCSVLYIIQAISSVSIG